MQFQHHGLFISECTLPGESHGDGVFAAHPNGIQVSRDRWLILYATRGMDGRDSDRSAVYQLRRDAPDGPLIKEGMLDAGIYDWDPLGNGNLCFKQHGHPTAFGVPKGALINGNPAPHANLFVIKWRVVGMAIDPKTGHIHGDPILDDTTQGAEWMQVRLNEAEDDIEVVAPAAPMRQKGYESGPHHCLQAKNTVWMNLTFVQAVPFNADCTQWADCNHFNPFGAAPFKYAYNPARSRYEWIETGPYLFESAEGRCVFEASLARWRDQWIVAGRVWDRGCAKGVAWLRTSDPFSPGGTRVMATTPAADASRTVYTCADGVLRLFTGDPSVSPYTDNADPLYCWDIDPSNNFTASNRRVIFDAQEAGLGSRGRPKVDMCKLLPPHRNTQMLVYRVAPRSPCPEFTPQEKMRFGIYCSKMVDPREIISPWQFE